MNSTKVKIQKKKMWVCVHQNAWDPKIFCCQELKEFERIIAEREGGGQATKRQNLKT